jgi:hypothetical protein
MTGPTDDRGDDALARMRAAERAEEAQLLSDQIEMDERIVDALSTTDES